MLLVGGCAGYDRGAVYHTGTRLFVETDALNLRVCPNRICQVIRVLGKGEGARVEQQLPGWVKITTDADQLTGWAATRYLSSWSDTVRQPSDHREPSPTRPEHQQPPRDTTVAPLPEEEFAH